MTMQQRLSQMRRTEQTHVTDRFPDQLAHNAHNERKV